MEQIILTPPGEGGRIFLQRLEPLVMVTKAEQVVDLLGQDVVNLELETSEPFEFIVGMRIEVFGAFYTLNQMPESRKLSTKEFTYRCVFEGSQYDLLRSRYFNVDATGFYTGGDFSLTGTLATFVEVLIRNANRTYGADTWVKGIVEASDVKTLTFNNANCLEALQQTICKEFEVEFSIVQSSEFQRTLNVKTAGQVLNEIFQYGPGKGLYTLTRRTLKDSSIVTRLYPTGSTENLKPGYRNFSTRLKIGNIGSDYLEDTDAIAAFGLIEAEKVFEDIKPHRSGTVTALVDGSTNEFVDGTMDFDLFETVGENTTYLINGKSPKIHFNTGNLAGYEFELVEKTGYNHTAKKFHLIRFTDERGLEFPSQVSGAFQISVGDTYVILDIVMPDSYVTAAEAELRTKAQNYLDANKAPLVSYDLELDPMYLESKAAEGSIPNFFEPGDFIRVIDADLNIDKASRITSFTRNIQDPFEYSLQIADSYQVNTLSRVLSEIKQLNNIVVLNDLRNPVVARQNWKSAQEALNQAFDPDGFLKDGKIRAESLQAAIALFGTEGQQFQIINMVVMPNYQGQKNVVRYTAGTLVHLTIESDNIRNWIFTAQTVSLGNDAFKYIYAKCHRTENTATLFFSEQQIKTKQDSVYYHFLVGSLSTVDSTTQTRAITLSYGFTLISGRWITTGVIQSSDGRTFFNLDTGEIGGNITFRGTDGENKPISELETELKALIEGIGEQVDGQIENWFLDGTPTLANAPAASWTTQELKEQHLGDLYYDQISGKSYRFRKNGSVYSWQEVTDDRVTQALLLASQAKDTADGKRRIFIAQPSPPYDPGDLWTNGTDLFRCITQKLAGTFDPLHWELATVYDNTVVVINNGIVTAGTIQLAGSGGTILAGITGQGTADDSVRFWAGAGFANRGVAPFRVLQSGEVFARKRIEMMNASNVGQAGICGQNSSGDGPVRMWAGVPYSNRNSAPWKVEADGKMTATAGFIGTWRIEAGGMINEVGDAYIIARTANSGNKTEALIGANVFPATAGAKGAAVFRAEENNSSGDNVAVLLSAKNANVGANFRNYAIYSEDGILFNTELLINGRATYKETITTSITRIIDISRYEFVSIFPNASGVVALGFNSVKALPIKDGKKIVILNTNDDTSLYLSNIIRGVTTFNLAGGAAITLIYDGGYWYSLGVYDNNW